MRICKSALPITGLLVLVFLAPLCEPSLAEEYIRMASFNIAEFGEGNHPNTRDLNGIAKMLVDNNLDLIAVQEVGVKQQAEAQIAALLKKMNKRVGHGDPKYFSFITPQSGDERCAVLYRSPVIKEDDTFWLDDDKTPGSPRDGGQIYYRIPVALPFEAGDFDFVLVILHLSYTNLERRTQEITALRSFLKDDSDPEKDWIVLGDMNRYGEYAKKNTNKAFDILLKGTWKQYYRFPLLEAITDPDDMKVFRAASDEYSTTIGKENNIYDQVIITKGAYNEFGTDDPAFGEHIGIITFDMEKPYNKITDHNQLKYKISDHRPMWIRFQIDLGDDD